MAISRMQQPRQMYGLGSFVKKAVKKITKPVTKIAKKIVPREVAGIMRVAAPFLPPGYREAAYLLGTAKQTGRISPMDLALTAAPTFFGKTDVGRGIAQRVGNFTLPGMETNLRDLTLGKEAFAGTDVPLISRPGGALTGKTATLGATDATSGILGKGGKFFQFGGDQKILDTKAGQFLLGDKDKPGSFDKAKLAGVGLTTLSLIQNANTPREAGIALAQSTGDSSDYDRGYELFSQLKPELFEVPEQFRAAEGGLMRTDYAMGAGEKGVVNPFKPKPQGPVLPEEDKPFKPKPLKPIKMAEFDLLEYQEEFERVFPDMKEKRGTEEYNEMLEDYFRGLAFKGGEGIMMASYGYDDAMAESFAEFQRLKKIGEIPMDMEFDEYLDQLDIDIPLGKKQKDKEGIMMAKKGGRANLALGTKPTPEESGLGGLPIEADMRYTGGFMPYGAKEKADDVPARLSKNEFVFTADAVRAAGGGSVNEGAKKMYATMKQLEKKPEAKGMMA